MKFNLVFTFNLECTNRILCIESTKNTITNETWGTAVTNPSASKPAVVNNKNVKKRSVKVVKNRIKKESCNNKIREKNQSKITSNGNRQKSVKLQH